MQAKDLKPYYDKDGIIIYNGDCFDVLPKLIEKVDLILTDPPYGIINCEWDTMPDLNKLWNILKPLGNNNCTYVFTASQPFTSKLVMSNLRWFKYEWIYNKTKGVGYLNSKKMPITNHENIIVFAKGKIKYTPQFSCGKPYRKIHRNEKEHSSYGKSTRNNGDVFINNGIRYPTTSILPISNPSGRGQFHPTQKPVSLMEYLIKTYTDEGDLICDPFGGSFTTAVACKNLNRRFVGCELLEKYCKIALKRLDVSRQLELI